MGGGDGTRQIFQHLLELCKAAWKTIREQCTSFSEKHVLNQTTYDERKKNRNVTFTTDKTGKICEDYLFLICRYCTLWGFYS